MDRSAAIVEVRSGFDDCFDCSYELQKRLGGDIQKGMKGGHDFLNLGDEIVDATAGQYVGEGLPWSTSALKEAGLDEAVKSGRFTLDQHRRFLDRAEEWQSGGGE